MDKKTILILNLLVKQFKDLPQHEDYPNMFSGSNVSYDLFHYHLLKAQFYKLLLDYAKGKGVQTEDNTGRITGEKEYIVRITDIGEINGDGQGWIIKEEILLYHEDEQKFLKSNNINTCKEVCQYCKFDKKKSICEYCKVYDNSKHDTTFVLNED